MNNPIITKTMILLFAVPLLSQAGVEVDLSGVKKLIAYKTQQESGVDEQQIRAATENLAMAAQMNGELGQVAVPEIENGSAEKTQDEQFQQLMQNLTVLTSDPLAE